MATEYKKYLATEILNEERTITYRLLSRAMKVHVNVAKEMLYEFHRTENKKKAGSVHATYLVAGSRYEAESSGVVKDGDDVVMSSQPFQSSPPALALAIEDDTPILSITLVREEDLEEARKSYESIVSIHVYSLGPTKCKDLQILSDANREVLEKYAGQNRAEYGTIINKNVRKRNVGGPRLAPKDAPVPATKATTPAQKKEEVKKEDAKPKMVSENKADGPSASGPAVKGKTGSNFFGQPSGATAKKDAKMSPDEPPASSTASKPADKSAALKRGNSGSIFASFAKAKPKEKSQSASAASSAAQSPVVSAVEDETMKDVSGEEEEQIAPKPKPRARAAPKKEVVKKETAAERKKREEREKKLRDMMDESDEDLVKSESTTPAVAAQDDDEDEPEEVVPSQKEKPEPKEYVEISGGRRRGKRRVMKKKTMRDEEGYLVTKEEPAWESFSEDEPVAKAKPAPSQAASQKKKPAGAKAGQGSIMAFFAKKT